MENATYRRCRRTAVVVYCNSRASDIMANVLNLVHRGRCKRGAKKELPTLVRPRLRQYLPQKRVFR